MNVDNLRKIWNQRYQIVPIQLDKIKKISSVATAFNTNIDAIFKISGAKLGDLIAEYNIKPAELENIKITKFRKPEDAVIGIFKCFTKGIAEEWVTEDIKVYQWLEKNLGYNHLQMGGQGGIIANALALLGIKQVVAHTNSHPYLQAKQFLDLENLYGLDKDGKLKKAISISREEDIPLIHWIIEFDKGDSVNIGGKIYTCPKSNRFIATYDPLNMNLVINPHFADYMDKSKTEYLLLSGFHPLLAHNNGVKLIDNAVSIIEKWKKNNPNMIIHLEIASTQDKVIRKAIIDKIAPLCQSAGLNERETIDLLEILGKGKLVDRIEKETSAVNLFDAILFLKETLNIPRIQLHMFGLYLTLQDERFPFTAEQNLCGMVTAAVVSSSKALVGSLEKYDDVAKALGYSVSDIGLQEISALAEKLKKPDLAETGVCLYHGYKVSAIPTIIIDNPKTLVGMGDTISSVSLLAGR